MLNLTLNQTMFLRVIENNPDISSQELQTIFSCTRGAIYDRVMFLKNLRLIEDKVIGFHGLKGYYVVKKKRVWK